MKKNFKENIEAKKEFQERIQRFFPKLCCPHPNLPLSVLFPPSKNKQLERFRTTSSHADLAFFLKDKGCINCKSKADCKKVGNSHVFAIFEPGGFQHKQKEAGIRDKKKSALCKENNTGYGGMINWAWRDTTNKTLRAWIGKVLYGRFTQNRREKGTEN